MYAFKDPELRFKALTHRSFRHENGGADDNERLEFLGDAILQFCVTKQLFDKFPNKSEGELSKLRAAVVCTKNLAAHAKTSGLASRIRLGRGEERNGGRDKDSILADAFEAMVAAVYLDGGMDAAARLVANWFAGDVAKLGTENPGDWKSKLQETAHASGLAPPEYAVIGESGPDHAKTYVVRVTVHGRRSVTGHGQSKKAAEQDAARLWLTSI